jgi:hypothetical protein
LADSTASTLGAPGNRRPTGQRGALLWFRTGSDVVVTNAFRLLNATYQIWAARRRRRPEAFSFLAS